MSIRLLITLTERDGDLYDYFNDLLPRERAPALRMRLRGLQYQNVSQMTAHPTETTKDNTQRQAYESVLSEMISKDLSS